MTQAVTAMTVLPVRGDRLRTFLPVMRNNCRQSRGEPGCEQFDIFLPEGSGGSLTVFERWTEQSALDRHSQSAHLAAVNARAATDVDGDPEQFWLEDIEGIAAPLCGHASEPQRSRNMAITLTVQSDHRATFIEGFAKAMAASRGDEGCLAYDLYGVRDEPQSFVLFERWRSVEDHLAHLVQAHMDETRALFAQTLAAPVDDQARRFLRDLKL